MRRSPTSFSRHCLDDAAAAAGSASSNVRPSTTHVNHSRMRNAGSLSLLPLSREAASGESNNGFRSEGNRKIWEFPTTSARQFR